MEKAPEALRTIREAAGVLGVEPHVLRFWEKQFPQLKPVKRRAGRRFYRPEDMVLLREIHQLLYARGFTIQGARQQLQQSSDFRKKETKSLHSGLEVLHRELSAMLGEIRNLKPEV